MTNNLYVVSAKVRDKLRLLRARRDEQAKILGIARIELKQREAEILYSYKEDERARNEHLGSVYFEYLEMEKQVLRRIDASQLDEVVTAEGAFADLGIDHSKMLLRIDPDNGVVTSLQNGHWIPLEKGVQ
jgi:hypothetical protein